ncbi:MAG: ras-related protein RabA [Gammaproteobacteria bacterium]|jgi:Ras-related protein Rab-1A|nr:ras-related protein RabA [Gammaproteobacteria bacterium]
MSEYTVSSSYDYMFILHLVGDSSVGKSCLLLRFTDGTYTDRYISTIGVDFKFTTISIGKDEKAAKLQIWDSAGEDRYRTFVSQYYQRADGIVLLFDITNEVSFRNIEENLKAATRNAAPGFQKILVGTKSDLGAKRVVDYERAKAYADSLRCQYIETSAKENYNIEKLFVQFAEQIAHNKYPNAFVPSNSQKPFSTSRGHATSKNNFTTEEFLLELNKTTEALYQDIATNTFFKTTKPVYDALRTFQKTYHITPESSPAEIIKAMGELTRACPEICHESSAKNLLQMIQQPTASRCPIQ